MKVTTVTRTIVLMSVTKLVIQKRWSSRSVPHADQNWTGSRDVRKNTKNQI